MIDRERELAEIERRARRDGTIAVVVTVAILVLVAILVGRLAR